MSETTPSISKNIKPCALCGEPCSHLGARGRNVVCGSCEAKATDSNGRPIEFLESFSRDGQTVWLEGPAAFYKSPDPEAGERCDEASDSLRCFIDGFECQMFEGFAGWVGLIYEPKGEVL
jgi:hypothetical protein